MRQKRIIYTDTPRRKPGEAFNAYIKRIHQVDNAAQKKKKEGQNGRK